MEHSLIITETTPTIASQTFNGNDPTTNEFKIQELQRTKH